MKIVSSVAIDAAIERLEGLDENQYEAQMEVFADAQPVIFAWLFSEQFDLLTEEEKGYLQYITLIIWSASEQVNGKAEQVSEDQLGEAEEANFEVAENLAGKSLSEKLDVFFEDYEQEELLALAEEAILEDEDDPEGIVTKEGRELIFVALKTVIDVLT
ncbi:MAG: hypothetical protein J0L99_17050 [Chitinophagales bacterium]|jgi:hypothetical protein|nr:hypothetical protein [Chitinophagales bacterium]